MKRIFLILPWSLILILVGIILLNNDNKQLGVNIPFMSPTSSPPAFSAPSTPATLVRVTRIVDGDTIDLSNGKRLRYIGIDTPETGDCFGSESTKKNKELVLDHEVRLEKDISETDRYKRLLRYVWVGEVMVNEEMVRQGFAKVSTYPPDVKYADRFLKTEREARDNKRGLWADDACKVEDVQTEQSTMQQFNNSTMCSIKGNISTSGDKIYHLPGCGSYDKTSINEAAGEHWFCSESEAVSAGWRKAKNC